MTTTIKLDPKADKVMRSMQVPKDLMGKRPFDLENHVISWRSEIDGMVTKNIRQRAQLECFDKLIAKPFSSPYTIAISSFPNDAKAKQVAAMIICRAANLHLRSLAPRVALHKELPLWHTVYGGWNDKIRDAPEANRPNPSLLVLSNLTDDSTTVKLEKARDLLEMYNDIPRIVVMTCKDPREFANNCLFVEVNDLIQIWTAKTTSL